MDAKPQKPMRAVRLNDENALPSVPMTKTLHHSRNKSSPALSTMAAAGAMRIAAKRAAFADVSNTAVANRLVKDDLILPSKGTQKRDSVYDVNFLQKRSSFAAPLARPAQRPLRDATNAPPAAAAPAPTQEKENLLVTSASTHKDPVLLESKAEAKQELGFAFTTLTTKPSLKVHSDLVIDQDLPTPELTAEIAHVQVQEEQRITVLPPIEEPCEEQASLNAEVPFEQTEPADIPLPAEDVLPPTSLALEPLPVIDPELEHNIIAAIQATQISFPQPPTNAHPLPPPPEAQDANEKALITIPEPEEYWDEEEDDENYEDEGYVTARSFRSRENFTGNATTLIVPRETQKARKEIAVAREVVESMKTVEDFEDEKFDTTMVAEYGDEIFDYLRQMEQKMQPNPYYMDYQTEIQWSMRSVLMDWIVQVHLRFGLLPETLFLCANYIDRFLSAKVVSLNKLQLVGATALFVAAKYEEINCPSVQEIVYMVDNGYTMDEVLKAERFMLSMLQFELGWPGPMSFLRRISKADDYDLETRTLAKYLLEITIMDERFLGCPPSYTAAGAHCMARMMLQKGDWSPAHVYYSNYTYNQLVPLIHLIFECCEDPQKHHAAIFDKYTDKRYKSAATFVSDQIHNRGFQPAEYLAKSPVLPTEVYDQYLWGPEYVPVVAWQ